MNTDNTFFHILFYLDNNLLKEDKAAILNDFNNVRWTLEIPPGKETNVHYHYSIEYPKDKDVRFIE